MDTRRRFSTRLNKLGTETAYSVAAECNVLSRTGAVVYPFHIGDLNFGTPPHIIQAAKDALDAGKTGYCEASGISLLRETIAKELGKKRGVSFTSDEVSVQPGGKPIIGKFLSVCMDEGDEVLYPSPGYPIYESQIKYLGGVGVPYTFKETNKGFELDLDYLRNCITPRTRILIFNNYQNPLGVASDDEQMGEIAKLCVEHDLWVLSDEAYFDLVYEGKPQSIVSLPGMKERTVILYTFSKSYCMTGWRLAAALGPRELIHYINLLNTNAEACTTHFIQYAGITALNSPLSIVHVNTMRTTLKQRRDVLVEFLNQVPGFVAYTPASAFYVMANVTLAMKMLQLNNLEDFRRLILEKTGVSFCTREHFGVSLASECQKYVRFAFSGINIERIKDAARILKIFMMSQIEKEKSNIVDGANQLTSGNPVM